MRTTHSKVVKSQKNLESNNDRHDKNTTDDKRMDYQQSEISNLEKFLLIRLQ